MPKPRRPFASHTLALAPHLIWELRQVARSLGYAVGVHGSLQRDIDLIAVPWTSTAVSARELAEAIQRKAKELFGYAENIDKRGADNPAYFDDGCPGGKPHGRLCWTFHLGGGPYIDLSVMPRTVPPYGEQKIYPK